DHASGALHVLSADLADERRDVDARGAGRDARSVLAIKTAIRLGDGLATGVERFQVGQLRFESAAGQQPHIRAGGHAFTSAFCAKCVGLRARNRPLPRSAMSLPFSNATRPPTMVRSTRPCTSWPSKMLRSALLKCVLALRTPRGAGSKITRSASMPTATEPFFVSPKMRAGAAEPSSTSRSSEKWPPFTPCV